MEERENSAEDKTEDASDERRKQYREQGNLANPREVVGAVSIMCFAMMLPTVGKGMFASMGVSMHRAFGAFNRHKLSGDDLLQIVISVTSPIIPWLVGLLLITMLLSVSTGLVLTKFNFSLSKFEFSLDKLNPVNGIMRMLSFQGLIELGKTLLRMIALGSVFYIVLKKEIENAELAHFMDLMGFVGVLGTSLMRLIFTAALTSAVLGIADFGWNWFQIERQMKMTKQEVKEELKGQEGDPQVKSQRRRMARDLVLRKNLNNVPTATFIVTNPEHFSVAIRYVRGMAAPIVVAKGQDFLALKIREIAKTNDIMIVENKPLARTLYKTVKVGGEVPASLYASVIEVMKYIYQARGRDYFSRFDLQSAV